MATEERLREELDRVAGSIRTDTSAALTRVVATARRRQRVRRASLAIAAAAVIVVGAIGIARGDLVSLGQAPGPAGRPSAPHVLSQPSDLHASARTVLTGEWQTESAPSSDLRRALTTAGLGSDIVDRAVGQSRRWFVQLTFSQGQGSPVVVVQTSDPTNPGVSLTTSEKYPYRLLAGNRLLVTRSHPGTRWVFSYRLEGDSLELRLLRAESGALDEQTEATLVSWTYAPLTLVH
jgi:hypothetical protein